MPAFVPHPWPQTYNPLGNTILSTAVAAIPVCLLFYLLAVRKTTAWKAAVYAFLVGVVIAIAVFRMPTLLVLGASADGLVYGAIAIAWVLVAAVFVYDLTVETGHFTVIMESIGAVTDDRRLQVLLIAYAFGSILEGAGGGGAPVAICSAMMVGLGFEPFGAAMLCLIANTAPVAFGGMGNPIRALEAVTNLPEADLSAMLGRILPWMAMILPFWLIRSQCGTKRTLEVWPGLAACGVGFAAIQFFWSNYMDAVLVDILGGMFTLVWLTFFFRLWKPRSLWRYPGERVRTGVAKYTRGQVFHAWTPFLLLAVLVIAWGIPEIKKPLDSVTWHHPVPGLHLQVLRMPPVLPQPHPEPALFDVPWLSSAGTATFFAGLIAGPILGLSLATTLRVFFRTLYRMRYSLLAIMAMLGLGFLTRYCGMDAVMGLAFTHTGAMFPFFGTLIGWVGVALSGTDAGSNALFGSLQAITARNLGISPVLMAAANSAGGVMGKMISAQSIIVACAATDQEGKEGDLFRAVLKHSIALAILVAFIVLIYAYWATRFIPSGHHFGL
ncbi:MAG TPA: lactate permease LctP family transporter [Bryobacteraceae bacterium]|nr:lactate permease LctP family transporter [Bryobacteraceae bacterium]